MFKCERCGSGYNGSYIGVESCPRCLLLDRVQVPLNFKMLTIAESGTGPGAEPTGLAALPAEAAEPTSRPPARSAS